MPPLPPVANVVLLRLSGTNNGMPFNNVFHAQFSGTAPTSDGLVTLAEFLKTAYHDNFAPFMNLGTTVDLVEAVDLTSPTSAVGITTSGPVGGSEAGTLLPLSAALVISWKINLRYRGGHPRTYLPAGTTADVTGGRLWVTTFQTEVNDAATAFRNAMGGLNVAGGIYNLCSVSYRSRNAPRPTPLPFIINANVVHPRVDTQRKRLGKELA